MDAIAQSGWVAIFVFSGLILLMLAGSLIFQWQWLLLLGLAGAALGIYRVRKGLVAPYAVAQILDRRLQLSDTLSTAYYLRSHSATPNAQALQYQLEQADRLAATVSPAQPFPFAGRKVWSIAGALALVCIGLFGVRYMVTESLSLRPALVSLQIAPIVERIHEILVPPKNPRSLDSLPDRPATKAENADGKEAQADRAPEPNVPPPPAVSNASPDGSPAGQQSASEANKSGAQDQAQAKPGDASMIKPDTPREPSTAASAQPGDTGNKAGNSPQSQTREQRAGSQNTPPGVMSRMKDALSSMMAKMNAASSSQQSKNGQQDATDSKSSQQSQAAGRTQQGSQQQQQQSQNQAANPSESAEGQAQGQTSEKQGTTQGKSSDQSAQKGSDAHSGVGQQDGDKDIKNAEQLKAMGKLAEIIGKRSANLTGDMTVETSSGKQQLKTSYSQRVGQHSDSGGEINHNQVPLAYQQYVREYMEQVRKQDKSNQ